jgi:hypothetical protein
MVQTDRRAPRRHALRQRSWRSAFRGERAHSPRFARSARNPSLRDALGRVLAMTRDRRSSIHRGQFVDGRATRFARTSSAARRRPSCCLPEVAAGRRPRPPNHAVRVMTGARSRRHRHGDRVEDTDGRRNASRFATATRVATQAARRGLGRRRRRGWRHCADRQLGVPASIGCGAADVHRPAVAILTSGDELVDVDHLTPPRRPHVSSNGYDDSRAKSRAPRSRSWHRARRSRGTRSDRGAPSRRIGHQY